MIRYTMKLSEGAALVLILSLALALVFIVTQFFHAFSFPWIAWNVLGFGAIVTFGRELIVVRDPSDGPAAGPIESAVNSTLVKLLLSTPAWLVATAAFLTLLFASVDTFGLLPTLGSLSAVYVLVIRALHMNRVPPNE